jgi:hypothetical protein
MPVRVAATIGPLSVSVVVLACLVLVALGASGVSFLDPTALRGDYPRWMAGPFAGLWPGSLPKGHALEWTVTGVLGVMCLAWALVLPAARRIHPAWILGGVLLAQLILTLGPPLQYTDIFNYINYGRLGVVHHLNPYTTLPVHGPHGDPAYAYSNWHYLRSPYGPLFTLLTYALVPLGVPASMWVIKAATFACSVALLALVWWLARRLGRHPATAVAFVGLNPIVLVWGVGAAHNDFLMVLLAVAAFALLLLPRIQSEPPIARLPAWAQQELAAGVLLVAAVGIKASAVLFLPVAIALARRRRALLLGLAGAALVLAAASLVAFGPHLGGVRTQSSLVSAEGLANLLGVAIGLGGLTSGLRLVLSGLAAVLVLWAAARVARRPLVVMRYACLAAIAVIFSLGWSAPWYVLWALPFGALTRRWRGLLILYTAYALAASCPSLGQLEDALHFHPRNGVLAAAHIEQFQDLAAR